MSEETGDGQSLSVRKPHRVTIAGASHSSNQGTGGGNSPITLGFALYVLHRWGKLAIPLGVVTMSLAAGLVLYLFEPQYRAEALLQIKKQRPMIAVKIDEGMSNEFVETQKQLLRSSPVISKVLTIPEIARMPELRREDDPKKWIEKHLEVKPVGGSELFTVAYQGPSAENSKQIVDAVVQSYFALQEGQITDQITQLLTVLKTVRDEQVAKVKHLEELVQETAKKLSGDSAIALNPNGKTVLEINPALNDLQQRLTQVEFDRQMAEIQIKTYEAQNATPALPEAEVEQAIAESPEVKALEGIIASSRQALVLLRPGTSNYQRAEGRIADQESRLEEARRTARERIAADHNKRFASTSQARLAEMNAVLGEYQTREKLLRARIEEERRQLESKTGSQYELEFLRNDLARAKQVADRIEDRISGLNIEYLSPQRPEQVALFQAAEAPRFPVEAYPIKSLAMAGLAGLLFPFAAFGAFELLSRRLYQSEQVQDQSNLTLVGEIAALPSRPRISYRGAVQRYLRDRAVFEESVESLRCILSMSPEWADARVLAVASAVSGEGKTSLASQLATGWAKHEGARTLIVDGDVRDPDIHTVFDIPNGAGLVEVLQGRCDLDTAIVRWDEQLHVLTAGTLIASPHRLFSGQDLGSFVEMLRERYDRVIIDVAPLLSASEVLSMLKAVDGVLLCARKDHSRAPQVKLARERLERAGIRRVGGVFGGLSGHSYAYQYGQYPV